MKTETTRDLHAEEIEMVKNVAETVEAYALGYMRECPHCGERIEYDREQARAYAEAEGLPCESGEGTCPACGERVQFDDYSADDYAEELYISDYICNAFDLEVTRSGLSKDAPIRNVELCVGFGGPNIYVDTKTKSVELYWWTDRASYPISEAVCDAIVDEIEQMAW